MAASMAARAYLFQEFIKQNLQKIDSNGKGKFFQKEDITLLGRSSIFANILLLLNIFAVHRNGKMFAKIGNMTSSKTSSEKNLLLHQIEKQNLEGSLSTRLKYN